MHDYSRYLDDIYFSFSGTKRQLNNILAFFNRQNDKIKFTSEISEDKLNFLDLTISIEDNKYVFQIYRKETYSDTIIHSTSFHPENHKMAAFNSMIHRMISIPLTHENYKKETNTIIKIAENNGYNKNKIMDMIGKKEKQNLIHKYVYNRQKKDLDSKPFKRILYLGKETTHTLRTIKNKKFKPAFYTNNNIKKYIFNNKTKIHKLDKSGVYKINCDSCHLGYIGQTGRKLGTRLQEHVKAVKNITLNSEMAEHARETGHTFGSNIEILHTCSKNKKLNSLENLEINKNKKHLVNKIIPPISSPLLSMLLPSTSTLHPTPSILPPPSLNHQ